ncbi:MAG: hypothetical protein GY870_16465, partial [archaeon]|nr:hypothetical protein [archaeon]
PEYPRPQLVRKEWKNLNGLWNYRITSNKMNFEEFNNQKSFDGEILVPYPVESSLSGVKKALLPTDYLWYHKTFKLNSKWTDKRILIHFGAIDWKSTIWINKKLIGTHLGGDVAFTYDITEAINSDFEQENEIIIQVWDPSDDGNQERGKQKLNPSGIFYNALSGIWQTVWIEPVPKTYIENIRLIPDIDNSEISVKINTNNSTDKFQGKITIIDGEVVIIEKSILINKPDKINIPNPKLWSPDSPFLYDIKVELIQGNEIIDSIDSYFGMRKSSLGKDK